THRALLVLRSEVLQRRCPQIGAKSHAPGTRAGAVTRGACATCQHFVTSGDDRSSVAAWSCWPADSCRRSSTVRRMQTVTTFVPRDADTCWRVFIDIPQLTRWVPGLRHAEILTKERGLPSEVHFQFAQSLAYTLVYTYDRAKREV